jgi:hypothetical protein
MSGGEVSTIQSEMAAKVTAPAMSAHIAIVSRLAGGIARVTRIGDIAQAFQEPATLTVCQIRTGRSVSGHGVVQVLDVFVAAGGGK